MPVERSIHGRGAAGKRRLTSPRSPPWTAAWTVPWTVGFGASVVVLGKVHVPRSRPDCRRRRSGCRLSGYPLSRDRASSHVDRAAHSMGRQPVEFGRSNGRTTARTGHHADGNAGDRRFADRVADLTAVLRLPAAF